jgi:hypothetical protein
MIWLVLPMAAAGPIELAETTELGPANQHRLVPECDCVRASWGREAEELVVEVPRVDIAAVVQTATADGQQEVSLRTKSGAELLLQRAPCPPSLYVATNYAALLQVSRIGDAADTACADLLGPVEDYERRRFTKVDQLEVALVSVAVTDRRGDPLLDVQRGLSGARALLAHCFVSNGTPSGSAEVRFVARADGTLDRVKTSGEMDDAVGPCLTTRLGQTHLTELPPTDVRARAALTLR